MDKNIIETPEKKNWAYIYSPCIIGAIMFVVIVCLYTLAGEEYINDGLVFFSPCLFVLLAIDFLIRFCLKKANVKEGKKALYIWVTEVMAIPFVLWLYWMWILASFHIGSGL